MESRSHASTTGTTRAERARIELLKDLHRPLEEHWKSNKLGLDAMGSDYVYKHHITRLEGIYGADEAFGIDNKTPKGIANHTPMSLLYGYNGMLVVGEKKKDILRRRENQWDKYTTLVPTLHPSYDRKTTLHDLDRPASPSPSPSPAVKSHLTGTGAGTGPTREGRGSRSASPNRAAAASSPSSSHFARTTSPGPGSSSSSSSRHREYRDGGGGGGGERVVLSARAAADDAYASLASRAARGHGHGRGEGEGEQRGYYAGRENEGNQFDHDYDDDKYTVSEAYIGSRSPFGGGGREGGGRAHSREGSARAAAPGSNGARTVDAAAAAADSRGGPHRQNGKPGKPDLGIVRMSGDGSGSGDGDSRQDSNLLRYRCDNPSMPAEDLLYAGLYRLSPSQLEAYRQFVGMLVEHDTTAQLRIIEDALKDARMESLLCNFSGT